MPSSTAAASNRYAFMTAAAASMVILRGRTASRRTNRRSVAGKQLMTFNRASRAVSLCRGSAVAGPAFNSAKRAVRKPVGYPFER